MIKALSFLAAGVLAVWIQSILAQEFTIYGAVPDLALIIIVYMGIFRNPIRGGVIAFCLGYMTDLFSGQLFGQYALVFVVVFYAMRLLGKLFYMRSMVSQVIVVGIMTLLAKLIAAGIGLYAMPNVGGLMGSVDYKLLGPQLALNLVFAPIVFRLMFKLEEMTSQGYLNRRMAGWF